MVVGFASFFGGLWSKRGGPRVVALTGGVLYGGGLFLASFSNIGLWWLYLSYSVNEHLGTGEAFLAKITRTEVVITPEK